MLITVEHFFHISLFTINLDMSYEKDPLKHVLAAYFNAARLPLKRYYPKLYLSDKEKNSINRQKPFAIIHLKASSAAKNFRNAFGINWDSVIEHLENTGFDIVEIGDAPGLIPQYYQSTSIREMIALMSKASLFIGIDSGPSHIAASLEIPSIVFFGAVNPEFRHFKDQFKGIILQQFCEYAGCYHTNPIAYKSHSCRLVGDSGIPKCCNFTTIQVVDTINELVAKYNIKHA
ncbi:glycosyltransferase family 9 protein [Flavihumibacter profundi]|uniref:glycosyltransferase family 9 protein n=1 Tax=Flavihumibacter profundi TaxID=2716883 RepID=UPI001CC76F0D|nr:glycosyltransferase family 9 protein [Flavihumibacter profundi]MBZ5856367.1 glycosyltransferase family 9 protein [Flavihumibacter profundi]